MNKVKGIIMTFVLLFVGGVNVAFADEEFVVGEAGGTWHYYDDNWERGKGKSGWSSEEKNGASIALVSTPNVWRESLSKNGGDDAYPMQVFLTNLSNISGPNIHVYGGYVVTKVEVKLRNRFPSNNSNVVNSMKLQLNNSDDTSVEVRNDHTQSNQASETYTFGYQQTNTATTHYLEPTAHLPISFIRSSLTNFSRSFDKVSKTDPDVFADVYLKITVGKIPQTVRYTIYDYNAATGEKIKKFRPEVSESSPNRYFTTTKEQYVGETPEVPMELQRWGCIYGYNVPVVGYYPGEEFPVEVFFKVQYAEEGEDADKDHLSFFFSRNENDEHRYHLQSAYDSKIIGWDDNWTFKDNTYTDASSSMQVSFNGDPYHFLFRERIGFSAETLFNNLPALMSDNDTRYIYWDLYGANVDNSALTEAQKEWGKNAISVLVQYDETKFPNENKQTFYSYTYKRDDVQYRTLNYERTRTRTRTNYYSNWGNWSDYSNWMLKSQDSWTSASGNNGIFENAASLYGLKDVTINQRRLKCNISADNIDYATGTITEGQSTTSYSVNTQTETQKGTDTEYKYTLQYDAAGIMLRPVPRPDNIALTYNVRNQHTTELNCSYTENAAYYGDPLALKPTFMKPFYHYTYYADEAFTDERTTVTTANWDGTSGSKPAETVYVKAVLDAPFELSDGSTENWYYVKVNGKLLSARGYVPYPLEEADEVVLSPMHLWKFVMNSDGTFSLQNRWYGDDYYLTNTSGNYSERSSFDGYTGAAMRKGMTDNAKWDLIEVVHPEERENGVFGLRNHASPNMNLSDYQNIGMMRYNDKTADLDGEACMTVVKYTEGAASSVATTIGISQLNAYIKEANSQVGAPFGFKTAHDGIAGNVAAIEQALVTPDNYNGMTTDVYYHVRLSGKTGDAAADRTNVTLLHVKANTDIGEQLNALGKVTGTPYVSVSDCITRDRIRAWLTKTTVADMGSLDKTDATIVFTIRNAADADDGKVLPEATVKMSAESYPVNANIAVPVSRLNEEQFRSAFDNCTVTIYPYGLGRVVLLTNVFSGVEKPAADRDFEGDAFYRAASPMLVSYRGTSVAMESAYVPPTPFHIEKADNLQVVMTRVNTGEPYFTAVNLPFDVQLPTGVAAYFCHEVDKSNGHVRLARINLGSDNVLPANTPVVLTYEEDEAEGAAGSQRLLFNFYKELTDEARAAVATQVAANKFKGTNFAFTVPMVDATDFPKEEHDAFKAFAKGSSTGLPGFYPLNRTRHLNIPANKAYIEEVASEVMEAKGLNGFTMFFTEDAVDDEGGVATRVDYVLTDEGFAKDVVIYDLQGRRVETPRKGVYIVNGKKVVFNQ